jgi:hypothetical protein
MGVSVDGASQSAFPHFVVHRTISMAPHYPGQFGDVALQAGWTVFNMYAIEE